MLEAVSHVIYSFFLKTILAVRPFASHIANVKCFQD